jgi:hypothetical protein
MRKKKKKARKLQNQRHGEKLWHGGGPHTRSGIGSEQCETFPIVGPRVRCQDCTDYAAAAGCMVGRARMVVGRG